MSRTKPKSRSISLRFPHSATLSQLAVFLNGYSLRYVPRSRRHA